MLPLKEVGHFKFLPKTWSMMKWMLESTGNFCGQLYGKSYFLNIIFHNFVWKITTFRQNKKINKAMKKILTRSHMSVLLENGATQPPWCTVKANFLEWISKMRCWRHSQWLCTNIFKFRYFMSILKYFEMEKKKVTVSEKKMFAFVVF